MSRILLLLWLRHGISAAQKKLISPAQNCIVKGQTTKKSKKYLNYKWVSYMKGKNCSTKPSRKEKTLKNMLYTFIANVLFLQQLWCMKGKVMVTQGHSQIPYYISLLDKIDSFKHFFIDKDLEPKNQGSTWQQKLLWHTWAFVPK